MVVVRWPGWAAEHRASLEFFAPLFVSRQKVEKKEPEEMIHKERQDEMKVLMQSKKD